MSHSRTRPAPLAIVSSSGPCSPPQSTGGPLAEPAAALHQYTSPATARSWSRDGIQTASIQRRVIRRAPFACGALQLSLPGQPPFKQSAFTLRQGPRGPVRCRRPVPTPRAACPARRAPPTKKGECASLARPVRPSPRSRHRHGFHCAASYSPDEHAPPPRAFAGDDDPAERERQTWRVAPREAADNRLVRRSSEEPNARGGGRLCAQTRHLGIPMCS